MLPSLPALHSTRLWEAEHTSQPAQEASASGEAEKLVPGHFDGKKKGRHENRLERASAGLSPACCSRSQCRGAAPSAAGMLVSNAPFFLPET